MALNINSKNYNFYKSIFQVLYNFSSSKYSEEFLKELEGNDPISFLNYLEEKSKSIAIKSLKIGIIDSLDYLKDYDKEEREKLDNLLVKQNLPTTNQLLSSLNDILNKVLKNKKIKNINEYYFIKEIANDFASEISENDRNLLFNYIEKYENIK